MPTVHLKPKDRKYTVLLLHPGEPLLFLGTSNGIVEVWNVDRMEKKAELHYLIVNEFGEQLPIEDPVVNLASSAAFELVYAFMGNNAYCINVELLTIVEKVPISEQVVSGNIAPATGEIGVITQPGYLSRWSPKFVERRSHIDFSFDVNHAYLLHDFDETRVILVFEEGNILVASLRDEPYTQRLQLPQASQLLDGINYDKNHLIQALILEDGRVKIDDKPGTNPFLPEDHLLFEGKEKAEDVVRAFVQQQSPLLDKEYVTDFRLLRESKDRYVAEVEKLHEASHYQASISEDSKTLHFALQETIDTDLETKTTAYSVIEKIASRYDINPRYLFLARRMGSHPNELIEVARGLEFKAYHRNRRIRYTSVVSIVLVGLALILLDLFLTETIGIRLYLAVMVLSVVVLLYWGNVNTNPKIPGITDFKLVRIILYLILLGGLVVDVYQFLLTRFDPPI